MRIKRRKRMMRRKKMRRNLKEKERRNINSINLPIWMCTLMKMKRKIIERG
jgi:hypothetical protein